MLSIFRSGCRRNNQALLARTRPESNRLVVKGLTAWALATAVCALFAAIAGRARAQTADTPPRSTMDGVYSSAQADRGEETYMSECVACHPALSYTGEAFRAAWGGRPLSDLFVLMRDTMPKNDAGALTAKEYAQVLAYILKINRVPAGKTELPAEVDALKQIRIEMPATGSDKK
jgi:mono/diheme cytochrome c family protein